jgi:uncharacterized protein YecT (DUF1311 family)
MKKGIIAGGVAVALVVFAAWLYASPYLALRGLKNAIEQQNPQAMYNYIDFPAFKQSLTREMLKEMNVEADKSFAEFGTKMVEGLVDVFVNPETMIKVFAKGKAQGVRSIATQSEALDFNFTSDKVAMRYAGFNAFELALPAEKDGSTWTFIMHRKGLGWKIDDVRVVGSGASADSRLASAQQGGVLPSILGSDMNAAGRDPDEARTAADAAAAVAMAEVESTNASMAAAASAAEDADADSANAQDAANGTVRPSFDCGQASSFAERMICADANLARLDLALASAYRSALSATSSTSALKQSQNAWRTQVRDICMDTDCMQAAYQLRIAELQNN